MGNHIYYARYLDLMEEARGEFFRRAGVPFLQLQNEDTIFPVIECHIRFKAPARYDDVLDIAVWVTAMEGVRLNFGYRITAADERLIVEAETRHVCTALNEKPKRVPEKLSAALSPFAKA